ncbi:ABC transporter permease [Petrotoga mexicana DSM 14811]|uniref:ABC transporter permease n=1 Tax=Petrotoga mexicana DSM 14811 TaxID=1122954 RepID=A0A2K1P8T7_9BACT|nr:ABC transporter permease [Petrotoga mexicana]PNR99200.1 ABC transporter permease [Petrotoga mexicana DSM 14811]
MTNNKKFNFTWSTQAVILLVVVAMWIFLSLTTENFLTVSNIQNILRQVTIQGINAVGVTLVIITAGIDLSVGSVVALVNILFAMLLVGGSPVWFGVLMVLALATGLGFVNGFFVHQFRVPPFIATLAMMSIARGAALLISGGRNVFGLPRSIAEFSSGTLLGIPNLFWFLIAVIGFMEFLLRKTTFGRYVYAVGSNPEAARLSGINIRWVVIGVYMIAGFLWGLSGILETSRLWMGVPSTGTGYELDAIAAAVLGGASLMGAQGSAIGAFLGALVMATIYNGSVLLNINPFWQRIIVGIILVITVSIDQIRSRRA